MEYVKLKSDRDVSTTFKTEMSPEAIEALKNSGDAIQILDLKVYQLLEFLATTVVDHNADGLQCSLKELVEIMEILNFRFHVKKSKTRLMIHLFLTQLRGGLSEF